MRSNPSTPAKLLVLAIYRTVFTIYIMNTLEFYQLGANPEEEAIRIKKLYADPGIDPAVVREFTGTVDAYMSLPLCKIEKRIHAKYASTAEALGFIGIQQHGIDIGMSIAGIKEFEVQDSDSTVGINVSGWVLSQFRRRGFASEGVIHTVEAAMRRAQDENFADWYGKMLWTSVHQDNVASQRTCLFAGFSVLGVAANNPERRIYAYETV